MKFTVVWRPKAETQLTSIWMDAYDRNDVSRAASEIEQRLRSAPESLGESRSGTTRIVAHSPLVLHFDVVHDDRQVHVLDVRYLPPHVQ